MNSGALITTSAIIVALIYAYRWLVAGEQAAAPLSVSGLTGLGPMVTPEGFLVAWGFVFLTISVISAFDAQLGGTFAVLIMIGDILTNAIGVSQGVSKLERTKELEHQKGVKK